jgi:SAM-dependent methyltransferase
MGHDQKVLAANRAAPSLGWREALQREYPELLEYLTRPAPFIDLLPLEQAKVLEIGPGFGQFTLALARRAQSVAALEVNQGQASFLVEVARQEGVDNVEVRQGGADCHLPYDQDTFDVVVLNLVLEWCATRQTGSHEEGQFTLLKEIARVLRPGGLLYLATKNRFSLKYLIGKPDEHYGGMRFGSALPRWLADKLYKGRPPGRLYSWHGLKSLLRRSGLEVVESWWAVPEVRYCKRLVPVADVSLARKEKLQEGSSRSEKALMKLVPSWAVKYLASGLVFAARKPS